MTVIGSTSAPSPYQSDPTSRAAHARLDYQALGSALEVKDLAAAQEAYKSLQENLPPGLAKGGKNPNSPKAMLQVLGSALESGTLELAQQAYAKLQLGMGEIKGRGHQKHNKGETAPADGGTEGTSASAAPLETYTSGGLTTAVNQGVTGSEESVSINIKA